MFSIQRATMPADAFIILAIQMVVSTVAAQATVLPHPRTMLLRSEAVHGELGLSAEQVKAVTTAVDQVDTPLWRLRDVPAAERDARARPYFEQLEANLVSTLSTRQIKRLDQITLQGLGIAGLLDSQVAARLKLSKGQREALTSRLDAQRQGQEQTREAIGVLNDRQRRVLASLTGPAFDISQIPHRACRAPELREVEAWINSEPLTLAGQKGKVVVLHFYAFGCINCVRNLPHYNAWFNDFPSDRVTLIGVHRPETQSERVIESVRNKAGDADMKYPIAIDNASRNWEAWSNRVWPSVYLIDKDGFVRNWWYGELNWQGAQGEKRMREKIEELLKER